MDRKTKGRLAEVKVLAYLPFSNNSKYDIIALKEGVIKRISVKYTSVKNRYGSWMVELRQIYRGNKVIKINKFNNKEFDLLAVYIGPENKVVLIDSIKAKTRGYNIKGSSI